MNFQEALSLVFLMTLNCISCCGETNDIAVPSLRFALPPLRLRAEACPNLAKSDEPVSPQPTSSFSVGSMALANVLSDSNPHSSVVRTSGLYLTRPEAPSDGGPVRYFDKLFTPEVIKIGKASVSCPLVTAIKRKDPLCLLSGIGANGTLISYILLHVSW